MVRLMLMRAALIALPFVAWWLWARWARRNGRDVGAPPWAWLITAAAVLVGLSLMAMAFLPTDTRGKTYVPGETRPDGSVSEGRYVTP